LQDFYTELHDPNSLAGNPVRLIARQKDPGAVAAPSDIPYPTIIRVLARVTANVANRVSFQQDQLARRLAAQGESRCAIARVIGTSETAVRKLLRRPPLVTARDGERCALALSVMAWTGIRPVQFDKITAFQFKPAEQTVWITQSLKRDRSFEKQLDAYGVAAFQAVADAQAWGPYDRKNALRMWKRAGRDEELPEPAPPPYKLRHSYVTAAMRDGALSPEEMCLNTGHGSPEQLKRTYGVNAHGRMRRKAAGAFAEGVAKQIAEAAHAAPPRQRGGVVVFPKAKKGAAVRGAAAGAKPGKRLAKG
jgi:integrase